MTLYDHVLTFSTKKVFAYVFGLLVIYTAVFTDKSYYELLVFITALLGLRVYENKDPNPKNNDKEIG